MYLYGWKYEGRKISDQLHEQILVMMEIINNPSVVQNMNWPQLQKVISGKLGVAPGQVRTIKSTMEMLGILKKGALNASEIPSTSVYSKDGRTLIELIATERYLYNRNKRIDYQQANKIKLIYKEFYRGMLLKYVITCDKGMFHPFIETLRAVKKYQTLDYWEWYLLNTCIHNDNNPEEQLQLDSLINEYRGKRITFKQSDIVENQLSHSYVLGNFAYTGLLNVEGSKPNISISINKSEEALIDDIIAGEKIEISFESLIENASIDLLDMINVNEASVQGAISDIEKMEMIDVQNLSLQYGVADTEIATRFLEEKRHIFSYDDGKYISAIKLVKYGINESSINSMCERIYEYSQTKSFFTARTLEQKNICPEVEEIGFDENFYLSLLKSERRFYRKQINGVYFFSATENDITLSKIIVDHIHCVEFATVDETIKDLFIEYGIDMTRNLLLSKIKGTNLYHDRILDYLYKDYESYYQDI